MPIFSRSSADVPLEMKGLQTLSWPERDVTSGGKRTTSLVFANDPFGVIADQYRATACSLLQRNQFRRRLLVTSPGTGDGKSTTAINLAWALSDRGLNVLLLELDLRKPVFRSMLGKSPAMSGVTEVLEGKASLLDSIYRVKGTSLSVASVEAPVNNAVQLLQTGNLGQILSKAESLFDWIVIDAPPVFPVSDVLELAPHTDTTVMVVRTRKTPTPLITRAANVLGDRLTFVLLNDNTGTLDSYDRYLSNYKGE